MESLKIKSYFKRIETLEQLAAAASVVDIYNTEPLNIVRAIKSAMQDGEFEESCEYVFDTSLTAKRIEKQNERYLLGMSVNYPNLVSCTCCLDLHDAKIEALGELMNKIYYDYGLYKFHSMIA